MGIDQVVLIIKFDSAVDGGGQQNIHETVYIKEWS